MGNNTAYRIYALIFNLFSHLPLRERAALLSPHMASFTDSLGDMEREFNERGYKTVRISGSDIKPKKLTFSAIFRMIRFFTVGAYRLATSKFVFLNDNFMPMSDLNFKKEAVITQLWHAEGAFKRFGLHTAVSDEIRERVINGNKKLSFVVCSSESVREIYAQAFGVEEEKVLPFGSPRADRYIVSCGNKEDIEKERERLFGKTDKKIILYAPTFRDDPKVNARLLDNFDFELFNERLSDRYLLVLRLHPQLNKGITVPDGVINMTEYPSVNDLIKATDMVITDYSSICLDYALVGKPSVFYAFDLEDYERDRSFYFEYKKYVPGKVAKTFEELINAIPDAEADKTALKNFVKLNFGEMDGMSAKRIADKVILEASSLSH